MGYLRAKEYGRKELEKINREAYGITYGRKAQRKRSYVCVTIQLMAVNVGP